MFDHKQLDFLYDAGETRRFHTWPVLREQNVADHSWHVAMLAHILYGQEAPGMRTVFLLALLTHDMAECQMGDIPSPAKRRMDSLLELEDKTTSFRQQWGDAEQEILSRYDLDFEAHLDAEELRRFKLVDAMEGAMYCVRERMMGNKLIAEPFKNFSKYIAEKLQDVADEVPLESRLHQTVHEREWAVFTYIKAQWEIANGNC